MKKIYIGCFLLVLIACGQAESDANSVKNATNADQDTPLYHNELFQICAVDGWVLEEEISEDQNVSFRNENTRVIITTASNDQSNDALKSKILSSFSKKVEVIEENKNYLSLETNRDENIRGDLYIHQGSNGKVVLVFMTPEQDYDQTKIHTFNENIELF
ncbi:hypothetical protein [Gracilibacillus kekensis]|uniref:Uncharacterized protein n=1 Tax=Gracilibacillus kekensis TaxID=1027249 RepID=A0A1M7N0H0_9BACI|nr:hypothetical protein [Gracilibacillus kekensis]SHM96421.1 hypothetical protein SAMN05216179_1437 [Gracilibacillus kekensis]